MNIAVMGTGVVGRTLAEGLVRDGHQVVIGTRNPQETLNRTETDAMGNPPFSEWHETHRQMNLQPYAQAAQGADIIFNATSGMVSLTVLDEAGRKNLDGKIVVDVSNPLDFTEGFPPKLSVCNTDSVGEQIQRAHPGAKVVKALNTISARLMIDPTRAPGEHNIFIAGDDQDAKETVKQILEGFGWEYQRILDLGEIKASRGLEMYLPLWLTLLGKLGTPDFNIEVRRG